MVSNSAYIYGANFIAQFRWESGFLRGIPWNPPWTPTGVKVPWSLFSVLSKALLSVLTLKSVKTTSICLPQENWKFAASTFRLVFQEDSERHVKDKNTPQEYMCKLFDLTSWNCCRRNVNGLYVARIIGSPYMQTLIFPFVKSFAKPCEWYAITVTLHMGVGKVPFRGYR